MFYKLQGNEMVFQLANTQVRETLSNYNKKQFVREVIINENGQNTQYSFSFTAKANQMLMACCGNCAMLGGSPLEYTFQLRKFLLPQKEGENQADWQRTRYSVTAGQRVGIPQNVVVAQKIEVVEQGVSIMPNQATNPQEPPITLEQANSQYNVVPIGNVAKTAPNAVIGALGKGFALPPKPEVETPTPEEMSVIRWAKDHPEKMDEANFISGFVYTLKKEFNQTITDARARKWYYQFYAKK